MAWQNQCLAFINNIRHLYSTLHMYNTSHPLNLPLLHTTRCIFPCACHWTAQVLQALPPHTLFVYDLLVFVIFPYILINFWWSFTHWISATILFLSVDSMSSWLCCAGICCDWPMVLEVWESILNWPMIKNHFVTVYIR